ncbi:cytochrome c peroxidase [Hymenobacter ginsengisoli]|uniref:Cytochrome c peroxidase n=1 Tax=Hymenobacter ginsengisoli TaxID=1051626 RepID=A0ABP8PX27_9BACT|nr:MULTISPECIES: cytochrome c peroxidase [unclassified Hymenobacter]MBO2030432.1 cytochrome-c peroxidase [Hymenobacter sp. BT559]
MRATHLLRTLRQPLAHWRLAALLALGGVVVASASCSKVASLELAVPGTEQPANFPAMVYNLAKNPPSAAAFELGKALFYDKRLSHDGTVSCGSCHQVAAAFAQPGFRFSPGVGGRPGARNAPALQNLRWRRSFMADGGVLGLELQALAPLTDAHEMSMPLADALARLNADTNYQQHFAAVYGPGKIDTPQFLRALAQFTASLTSANSRYDKYVRHEAGGEFTAQEVSGLAVFKAKCGGCHATDLFTDESFRNNGLDRTFARDSGRAHITSWPTDRGRFRVPSLRNVAATGPYMHDGRFATLAQVLAHYNHGVQPSATLDPLLRQPDGQLGITLTAQEQAGLLTFLNTLTDQAFLTDNRLGPPH